MFTDEPLPFKPPAESGWALTALVIAALGAFGVYTYLTHMTERSEVRSEPPKSAPLTVRDHHSEQSARSPVPSRIDGEKPAPVPPRLAASNTSTSTRTTIYLCKAYSGGSFWSDTTCSAQRATIDRMTTVPASLSFQQQVAIARGEAQEAAMLYESPQPVRAAAIQPGAPVRNRSSICDLYDLQVRDLDAQARRPLPAFRQDQIRADRMNVMSARARERC